MAVQKICFEPIARSGLDPVARRQPPIFWTTVAGNTSNGVEAAAHVGHCLRAVEARRGIKDEISPLRGVVED